MAEETLATVKQILARNLETDAQSIVEQTDIASDLGADSLDALELIMAVEEEFDIEIPPAQTEGIKTVADLVVVIDTLRR